MAELLNCCIPYGYNTLAEVEQDYIIFYQFNKISYNCKLENREYVE